MSASSFFNFPLYKLCIYEISLSSIKLKQEHVLLASFFFQL